MATLRRKYKAPIIRRLEAARTALAEKYGNLYGLPLKQFFAFNGQHAAPRSPASLKAFEDMIDGFRKSRGTSAVHRARREAERSRA